MNNFSLIQSDDGLGERIIIRVADATNRWLSARLRQALCVTNREILTLFMTPILSSVGVSGNPGAIHYRGFISRFQGRLPQIDKAQVYLTTAIFEDTKQGWMKGKFMQRISDTEWKALSIDR
jgi:hypothetical protein